MSGSLLAGVGRTAFQLSYQISPIFLTSGVAQNVYGGVLPIVLLTEGLDFALTAINGQEVPGLDDFFAQFNVLPGGTLAENEIGRYTFANQSVAANAIIAQPLKVSLEMLCPVRQGTYIGKLATMTTLQSTLAQHNAMGGLYTVATPSFIYTNCILRRLVDVSDGSTKQRQMRWQWDFEQPLVTLASAMNAMNNQMSKLQNGLQSDGSLSGPSVAAGNPQTNVSQFTGGQAAGGGLGGGLGG